MFQRLKELFSKPQILENLGEAYATSVAFEMLLRGQKIGTLEFTNGKWTFSYSLDFKQKKGENLTAPLFGFPDIEKKYESDFLWPLFAGRIPGLKQPDVQEILDREHIDKDDLVALLKRFGKKTITNPFELLPA